MIHEFTKDNIDAICEVLGARPKQLGNDVYRIEIENKEENCKLALEIHLGLKVDGNAMNMVSVYSGSTFIQLHNCTAFVASSLLQQVTFFGKFGGHTSGLIVEKSVGCSMYANVNDDVLTGDFTSLPEDLMMCGVALSLTETEGFDDFSFDDSEQS
ncbi:MAG: hypothetical protein ACNA78_03655 [Balneolaceae bacterium]